MREREHESVCVRERGGLSDKRNNSDWVLVVVFFMNVSYVHINGCV